MRRLIITALVIAGIAAAAIIVTPVLVSSRLADLDIAERVGAWTGEKVRVYGEPDVALFPSLAVEVEGVVISGMAGAGREPYATVPLVRASLDILPLLAGRVEVGTLTLVDPRIHFSRRRTAADEARAADRNIVQTALDDVWIDEIILRNGSVTHGGNADPVTAVNLRFARLDESTAAGLSGTFEWRGALVEIEAEADDVPAVFDGNGSTARLRLAAAPASSPVNDGSEPTGQGAGSSGGAGSNQSLRLLVERLGIPIAPASTFGPLEIAGTFAIDEKSLSLSDAAVAMDGDEADGEITARIGGGGPVLKGSLEFETLGFDTHVDQPLHTAMGGLFAARPATGWLSHADVDLAVSAHEVELAGRTLADASATLLSRDGRLALTLSQASLAGGRVSGQVGLEAGRKGMSAQLSACLYEVSVAQLVGPVQLAGHVPLVGMQEPVRGTGSAALALEAAGDSPESFTRSISGVFIGNVRDGSIGGIDVESTLERLVDGNTVIGRGDAPFIPVTGRTEFDLLSTYVPVDAGRARDGGVRLYNDRYYVSLFGGGDLARGEIDVEGTALLFDPGASGTRRFLRPRVQLPFGAGGTIRKPMIVPGIPRVGYGPHHYLEPGDAAVQSVLHVTSTRPPGDRSSRGVDGPGARAATGNDRVGEYRDALARCGSGTVP